MVGHRFAYAGFPVLFRNVCTMNTLSCMHQLQTLGDSPFGSLRNTKHLTIYHGTWPLLDCRGDWDRNALWVGCRSWANSRAAEDAFRRYTQFITQEALREFKPDAQFRKLIHSFPTLNSITISHVNRWDWKPLNNEQYNALIKKIWILPYWTSFVADAVFSLLNVLHFFPHIRRLNIFGSLSPEHYVPGVYPAVSHLQVRSLISCNALKTKTRDFLASFPNLSELSISLEPGGPLNEQKLLLDALHWPQLCYFALYNVWISENELFGFVERHGRLRHLALDRITLIQGSWESFFVRYRDLQNRPSIEAQVLFAISSPDCVVEPEPLRLFLSQKDLPWPFFDLSDGIFPFDLE
ncbi:hypothetical protein B0H63DRAFT_398707 [Podospora didyma]|uniref:Uncharacterized protein n=1 Tax=Podospora didyma TaxID=330526 RepID=A0AAE0KJY0_9PEZI|nr:hypothetical protein B0H63DRAFT_398707 [Podospora didyma]